MRDKSCAECLFTESFVSDILFLCEHSRNDVAGMALRCLINLMNENVLASDYFINGTTNGINRLVLIIHDGLCGNRTSQVMHMATKLLYMLLSQRY